GADVVRAARDGRARRGKDPRSDDRADAERGQIPLAEDLVQAARRALGVDVNAREELAHEAFMYHVTVVKRSVLLALVGLVSCGSPSSQPETARPTVRMLFDRPDFYAAPFPSDDMSRDGEIAIDAFPNDAKIGLVDQAKGLVLRDAHGFSQSGGVFFTLTGEVSALPTMAESILPDAKVFLM